MSLLYARCAEKHNGDGWCGVTRHDLIKALGLKGLSKDIVSEEVDDDDDDDGETNQVTAAAPAV